MEPRTTLPESRVESHLESVPPGHLHPAVAEYYPAEFWEDYYDKVELCDGVPVDSEFAAKEMRLLAGSLNAFWKGPGAGGPFLVQTDVGLFYSLNEPPVAPDVMIGLVKPLPFSLGKKAQAYFVWEYGKPPEGVIEIVSNKKGCEDTRKLKIFEEVGIPYYIIHDPANHLGKGVLRIFHLVNGQYQRTENPWLEKPGLRVRLWEGTFEFLTATWLRWYDEKGEMIPTPEEMGRIAASAADQAKQAQDEAKLAQDQATEARERAQRLEARLRELGIDPNVSERGET